ncbi:hypothetical protein [Haloarchaeobius sp. TZWWS8]|uniref:hypothetical protein n=1 Tax=Haloarchaeobius sp. TZWWS8 TaxID=3446121 RepID=UPI003EB88307
MAVLPVRSVWAFARDSTFVRWVVAPMLILGMLTLGIGMAASRLSTARILEVTGYFLGLGSVVMVTVLTLEYVLRRLLATTNPESTTDEVREVCERVVR